MPERRIARDLARGPARLCQALGIRPVSRTVPTSADARSSPACACAVPEDAERGGPVRPVEAGPRVGVTAAAEVPWRYWLSGDPTVSAYRLHKKRAR